jgi:hypothetical protein
VASPWERLRTEWTANVGLVSSLAFLLVAVRILAVAHFDLTTGAAILQRGGTSSVLLGAALATLPSIVAAAVPALTAVLSSGATTANTAAPVRTGLIVLALILWVFLVPQYLAAGVGMALYVTTFLYLRLEGRAARSDERSAVEKWMRLFGWEPGRSVVTQARQETRFSDAVAEQEALLKVETEALASRIERASLEDTQLNAVLGGSEAIPEAPPPDADRARQQLEDNKTVMSALQQEAVILEARCDELARVRADLQAWEAKAAPLTRRNRRIVLAVISTLTLAILASSLSVPWLPTEGIGRDGGPTFTAYVLDETDHELIVLRDRDRAVIVIPSEDNPSRTLCVPKVGPWRQSLLSYILGARYPQCPSG